MTNKFPFSHTVNEKLPLTRSPIRPPPPSASRARLLALRAVPLLLLPAIYLSDTYSPFNTGISQLVGALEPPPSLPLLAHPGASCPVQHEMKDVPSWKPEEDQEYIKLAIERLQGAVQIVSPPGGGAMRSLANEVDAGDADATSWLWGGREDFCA